MSLLTPAGSAGVPLNIPSITGATTPTVVNVPMASAGTEYSYTFPTGTKQYLIKARVRDVLQFSYVSGNSGTTYVTIQPGVWYGESDITLPAGRTIYIQSATQGSQTLEVLLWT